MEEWHLARSIRYRSNMRCIDQEVARSILAVLAFLLFCFFLLKRRIYFLKKSSERVLLRVSFEQKIFLFFFIFYFAGWLALDPRTKKKKDVWVFRHDEPHRGPGDGSQRRESKSEADPGSN